MSIADDAEAEIESARRSIVDRQLKIQESRTAIEAADPQTMTADQMESFKMTCLRMIDDDQRLLTSVEGAFQGIGTAMAHLRTLLSLLPPDEGEGWKEAKQ